MAQLILIRHAKAVDRMDAEDDFDRGLTPRGKEEAEATGYALQDAGLAVELCLVSPSQRTMQTFMAMRNFIGKPDYKDLMALYHASPEMIWRAASEHFEKAEKIAIIGHNPGIGTLAHQLASHSGSEHQMPDGYPTASAAAFELSPGSLTTAKAFFFHSPGFQ